MNNKMKNLSVLTVVLFACLHQAYAPPVTQNKDKDKENEGQESDIGGLEDYMEYHRYLKEVVNALESDPEFRKKLENANESDIKTGKIAEELEFVSHNVRTRLDEIKRVELQRLRELTERKLRLQENLDMEDPTHRHLDHANPHTFEIDDLKKLIAKTTEDLAEADRKRRKEFKEYELQKEYEKQAKLNHTSPSEREKLEKEYQQLEEKHKKHEKLHEPGHKAQLEEVWEEQDQMQQEFDPKTFFMLHDLDSNGLWDQDEVKALFVKELEKMYAAGAPEDDMRERAEEMERMRESVFKEVDVNRDGFIDFQEFLAQTKRNDFQQDHGWQGLDEQKPYSDEEWAEYVRMHQLNEIPQGQIPPGAYQQVPPGYYPGNGPQQQFHPGQLPSQPPQPLPGQLPHLNTNEVYPHPPVQQQQQHPQGGYQQQPPQGGYQQQHPQGGYQQQPPQGGYQQQPNQGGYQQQPPQGGYQQQPPQGGYQQQQQQQPPPQSGYQQQQQQPPANTFQQQGQIPQGNLQPQQGNPQQSQPVGNQPPQVNYQQQQQQQNQPSQNIHQTQQAVNTPQVQQQPQQPVAHQQASNNVPVANPQLNQV